MRIWVRQHQARKPSQHSNRQGYSLLPLSTQTFTSGKDILALMQEHVAHDDTINTIMVEMESEYVPVLYQTELRIIATLAALYHNASIASACKHELDLYRNPYTECIIEGGEDKHDTQDRQDSQDAEYLATTSTKRTEVKKWDEEIHGDQRIYDETWEMNEDLVPWKLSDLETEERYGLYM